MVSIVCYIALILTSSCQLSTATIDDSNDGGIWHSDQGVAQISNAKFLESKRAASVGEKEANSSESQPDNVCDFKNQRLRVAVSPQAPLVNCFQNLYGDWLCNGSNIEVIQVLERRLHFQADWIVLADNHNLANEELITTTGRKRQQEQRTRPPAAPSSTNHGGVLGMVGRGRAWMSANGVMSTPERSRSLLLSEPFDSFKIHFLLSKSVRDHDHIFVKPFSSNAWLAILAAALAVVPLFYLVNSTSSHYPLQADKPLKRISSLQCLRYLLARAWRNLNQSLRYARRLKAIRKRRKSSSSSSDFDNQLDRMAFASGALNLMEADNLGGKNLVPTALIRPQSNSKQLREQLKRRRRLLRHQWVYERRRARRINRLANKSGFFKVAYIVWYVVGSLATQGGETEDLPSASSTRILIAFWWLYLIVICSIHSGILTAILTFPKQNDFIQTLDDFLDLESSSSSGAGMKLTVNKHSELANFLSKPENLHKSPLQVLLKQHQQLSTPIVHVDFQRHRQRILDEIQRGQSAYMEEKSTINLIITQEYMDQKPQKCHFKSSRHPIDIVPMSLVLSSRISKACVRSINVALRHIMRTGLAQKWRRKYEAQGNDCLDTVVINAGDVDKIELRHVMLAFWLLLVGLLLGALFLVAEVVWLLTADGGEEEDESSGFSCSSSSSSSSLSSSSPSSSSADEMEFSLLRLGHRTNRAALATSGAPLRDKLASQRRRPLPALAAFDDSLASTETFLRASRPLEDRAAESETSQRQADVSSGRQSRAQRRAFRASQRRAQRLKRTVELVRRLREGKLYSSTAARSGAASLRVPGAQLPASRLRRASQALAGAGRRLLASPQRAAANKQTVVRQANQLELMAHPIRRRRTRASSSGKVAPVSG